MFHQLLKPALIIFSLMLPAWFILRLMVNGYRKNGSTFSLKHELTLFWFYTYIICVLLVTVVPIPMTRHQNTGFDHINFIPVVHTLKEFIATFSRGSIYMKIHTLENVPGNVVLFFPLGVLLPVLSPAFRSLKSIFLTALVFSFSIELTQFIWQHFGNYRSVDIDDIILNTLGGVLGYAFAGRRLAKSAKPQ
ncbi:VanZ family protein [Mucilaginibacter sp. AW1-3]